MGHFFLYPVGHFGFTAVTFFAVFPFTQVIVVFFGGVGFFEVTPADLVDWEGAGVGVDLVDWEGVGVGVGFNRVIPNFARLASMFL